MFAIEADQANILEMIVRSYPHIALKDELER